MISTAYERTSVIVTTNLPFEPWTEVLGSERLTGAVLNRLSQGTDQVPEVELDPLDGGRLQAPVPVGFEVSVPQGAKV